ncbi:MAG TPA: phosphotransferase, partial [Syntrophales bacterium]|nr:phosphotransferase [Syntrophales bacterium]
ERMPATSPATAFIHNDYRFDNVVLAPEDPLRIIGVLDWEMATVGDPLMDLGGALAYWVDREDPSEMQAIRLVPTHREGMMTRGEVVAHYCAGMGLPEDNMDFYYTFGLFRLAVIAQQIYYRFYHGQTRDQRFGMLIFAVHVLEKKARQVMETGRI